MNVIVIVVSAIFFCIFLFFLAGKIMQWKHGDCNIFADVEKLQNFEYEKDERGLKLSFEVPIVNTGKQHGLIIDLNARLQPKGDIFRYNIISCRIINMGNVRFDDYWEGLVLKPNKTANLKILLSIEGKFKEEDLETFNVDLLMRHYGRGLMQFKRTQIPLKFADFKKAEKPLNLTSMFEVPDKPLTKETPADLKSLVTPVRTHILMPGEKLSDIIKKYIKVDKDNIFTIAESALAIIQSRVYYVDDVNPGGLATFLSHFFLPDSSLSSPYSMRKAMDEVGTWRIILAVVIGMLGRIVGRSGDFYRVAGKDASVIDDCTGTLPPFDKYVVMGPANAQKEMEAVKKETGMDAAVIDANDLHKFDILAQTGDLKKYLAKALECNPAGNGNEQTPIVLIKKKED